MKRISSFRALHKSLRFYQTKATVGFDTTHALIPHRPNMAFQYSVFLPSFSQVRHSHSLDSSCPIHFRRPVTPSRAIYPIKMMPRASFTEDFLAGPSDPPRPRPLYQVILFTVTTNLIWYGYYKYCIEEELRKLLGEGPGGIGTLAPFMVGVTSPLYLPRGGPAEFGVAFGILWIVCIQFYLYRRINKLIVDDGGTAPLTPWWIVVPGFNLIVGLRSVHFLSTAFGAEADADPVVEFFPFLGTETLGIWEFLTTPSLWVKFKS